VYPAADLGRSSPVTPPDDSRPPRPVIEDVRPRVDDGRYDAKAVVGDEVRVAADAFADGHDDLRVAVQYRVAGKRGWARAPMTLLGNDRWVGSFVPSQCGRYQFFVQAGIDHFGTWARELTARIGAGQDVALELQVGAELVRGSAANAKGKIRKQLSAFAEDLAQGYVPDLDEVNDAILADLVAAHDGGELAISPTYGVRIERARARFSTWYELFPRSASKRPGKHGTFNDVVGRLDYLVELGIDVLYLPPIHPIGTTARKGRNGATTAKRGDVGSPWAIGSPDGGHTAIHSQLGTFSDLSALITAAAGRGIEIALDIAFQCSPDHPWVTEHPEWFKHRPDGSIRPAENPPKRYEDIYPLDFETTKWRELWEGLHDVVQFWVDQGITIFRVDNPHTKPFAFWEWLIPSVQSRHGDVIFLAEAFTRPKVMKRLAKVGFTQSYTYFTWRTVKWELEEYLRELTATDVGDYFRPSFWPNTPDILTEQLQHGDRGTFKVRALLAGTLSSSYGIYGPVFELTERAPRHVGSEEYLDGEKYELRHFDLGDPVSIAPFLSRLNLIRRQQLALQHNRTLVFHPVDNDQLMAFSKTASGIAGLAEPAEAHACAPILVIVNLDTRNTQSGWVELDLNTLGLGGQDRYVVRDLMTGDRYEWTGSRNFVILDPASSPAHLLRIETPALSPALSPAVSPVVNRR
jgi:starch synthase (maltosyl-transferring)